MMWWLQLAAGKVLGLASYKGELLSRDHAVITIYIPPYHFWIFFFLYNFLVSSLHV